VADRLDDQIQMDDYQREILEKALAFYERFALPQSHDSQVRLEAARAGLRAGGIRSRLGDTAGAEQADRRALEILSGLVSEHSAEPTYREALARAHHELGAVFCDQERRPEAERELKEAAALWDALARDQPEFTEYRSKHADALARLGDQYMIQGRAEEATAALSQALDIADRLAREQPEVSANQESLATILKTFSSLQANKLNDVPGCIASDQRSVEIMEKLARDHPEMTKYQLGLGVHLSHLGNGLALGGKFPQAEALAKQPIAILEKLAADHPQDMKIATALADAYWRMSTVLRLRGDAQSALEWSGRFVEAFRLLARRDPRNRWISRTRLCASLADRAETLTRHGRLTEALAGFKEAFELAHDSGSKNEEVFRVFHALTKARLGDRSELALLGAQVRDILKAAELEGSDVGYWYYMLFYDQACVHAALAQLALQDQGRPPAGRQQLADRDTERALELLDKARAGGEFKGTIQLDEVRRDSTLDPLRSHPRFQLLMLDLAFPDDPFRP
jgi:tetratricopeptide (TPR) repeat protein